MALIITIIILLILASIATYSGVATVKSARLTAFTTELKIMQTEVNNLYGEYKTKPTEVGKTITGVQQTQFNTAIASLEADGISISSSDQANYTYFDQETIQSLGIEGVEGEFFVNVVTRSVISCEGFNYENKRYYTLSQLPNGLYNVDYEKNENVPTFDVSCENWVNGKSYITISNIQYEGNIQKWEVKYKLKNQEYWNTSEDLTLIVETPGTYIIKISNGAIESEEKEIEVVQANSPNIVEGMTQIMFNEPYGNTQGSVIKLGDAEFKNNTWYDYGNKKWANTITKDGSMWVWIPRYAYKITYTNPSNKSEGGTIDVKFLVGTTDQYYDDNGKLQTAKRVKLADEEVDTTTDYYVHPAFTDESSINYANGGWDSELTGIWVAKFEAGYASGNNDAEVKASSVNYTQASAYVAGGELGGSDATATSRNWLDGEYGLQSGTTYTFKDGTAPAIKYPTFQPLTYSMNYISINDVYNISRALTESGNIYGFNSTNTDSHLMKNSEWGTVAYLGYSKYGLDGDEICVNNVTLDNSTQSVYAMTGLTTGTTDGESTSTTIDKIKAISGNSANTDGVYMWNQIEGQKTSTTGNMYGIYDVSGGTWERTAGYVANGNDYLNTYGESLSYDEKGNLKTISTKYTTVYPHNEGSSGNINTESENNYKTNTKIFGDVVRETSIRGIEMMSWNSDYSNYPSLHNPFMERGGRFYNQKATGIFAYNRSDGYSYCDVGFRSALICK